MRTSHVISPLALLGLALLCAACGDEEGDYYYVPPPRPLALRIQDGDKCLTYLDGHSANRRVRILKILNNTDASEFQTKTEVVRLRVPPGLTVETPIQGWTLSPDGRVIEGEIRPGETLCVPLYFDDIAPGAPAHDMSVWLESFVGGVPKLEDVLAFEFDSRPNVLADAAFEMLTGANLPVDELRTHSLKKPRYESSWTQPARETEAVTDIVAHTTTQATLTPQHVADIAAVFVPGPGATAFTVPASTPEAAPAGAWSFFTVILDAVIPLADPDDHFQYVFTTKLDMDDANDYMAPPAFPGDTYRETDIQFALTWTPQSGWQFTATDSRAGNLQEIATAAWVAIRDNALMFAIPPGQSLPSPPVYLSAFRHDGTWGQAPPYDWSMDYFPLRGDEPD